jgi:cytochrome P450
MVRNPIEVFERYRRTLGPTFTVHLGGGRAAIVSTAPDFVQHVLQKNAGNYEMSDIRVKRMGEFQGQGLLNSHGAAWLTKRRFLAQGFTPARLAALVPAQARILEVSLAEVDSAAERGPVDVGRVIMWINFRLFGNAVFGSRMTDEDIEHIASTIRTIQQFIVHQIVKPYMIPWYRLSGRTRHFQRLRLDAERVVRAYVASHMSGSSGDAGDLLELMLHTPYPSAEGRMSEEQVLIEALQLFVAGNETSPTALSWALYLLGRNPHLVPIMREEIQDVFGNGSLTFDGLHELRLTRHVLEETLRLYPSFWMMDRMSVGEDEVGGTRIPAGVMVLTYLYGLHRNPDAWANPEVFDPSRFEPEAKKGRSPFAYLPFGGGPRKCIGSSMSIMQMLLILAGFVRRYRIELTVSEPVGIRPMMILHPASPIMMRLRRIR